MSAFQRLEPSRGPVVLLLAAYAWVLFIAGCSPSLDEAKLVLQQRVASQSRGRIKLVSFKKVEVHEFQVNGMQECRISYEGEIEFEDRGVWSRWAGNGSLLSFRFSPNGKRAATGSVADVINDLRGDKQMREGDRLTIVGVTIGTKSPSG